MEQALQRADDRSLLLPPAIEARKDSVSLAAIRILSTTGPAWLRRRQDSHGGRRRSSCRSRGRGGGLLGPIFGKGQLITDFAEQNPQVAAFAYKLPPDGNAIILPAERREYESPPFDLKRSRLLAFGDLARCIR